MAAEVTTELDGVSAPFAEQLAFFRRKGKHLVPTKRWDDLQHEQHDFGFMVAGATKAELLADLHREIQDAIEKGTTLDEFTERLPEIAKKHGWTGWRGEKSAAGVAWRARVIYETNLRQSYNAGRYRQLVAGASRRPFWEYRHSPHVTMPRKLHQSWDGKVLRWDDPWWDTHFPQNGWGCRCSVFGLNDRDLKRRGKSGPDEAPDDGDPVRHEIERVDRETGEVTTKVSYAPPGIDPGFAYTPGKADLARESATHAEQRAETLPNPLRQAVERDVAAIRAKPPRPPQAVPSPEAEDSARVAEAQQRTQALGVKVVDYGPHPALAENVTGALEELAAKGARMPDVVVADADEIKAMTAQSGVNPDYIAAAFKRHSAWNADLLYLNPDSPAWAGVSVWLGDRFSTKDERHIVRHEIGHLEHAKSDPHQYYGVRPMTIDEWGLASSVSDYAQTDLREFVAEVFAALVAGRTLSIDVLRLYRKLGGKVL